MSTPDASLDSPSVPVPAAIVGHGYVLPFAPPMPEWFFGEVRYVFKRGALVSAVVEERVKG